MATILVIIAILLAYFKENKCALSRVFIRTKAALYKGFIELGITATQQGATLIALYDTRPHSSGGKEVLLILKNIG